MNGLSVHPSGKLALTVSRDKTLKTWNLIEGKCAYTTNLKAGKTVHLHRSSDHDTKPYHN